MTYSRIVPQQVKLMLISEYFPPALYFKPNIKPILTDLKGIRKSVISFTGSVFPSNQAIPVPVKRTDHIAFKITLPFAEITSGMHAFIFQGVVIAFIPAKTYQFIFNLNYLNGLFRQNKFVI